MNTVLQSYLQGQPELTERLAAYDGRAAIFDGAAPPADDPGWQGETLPHIVCTLLLARDPEKGRDGRLGFRIFCETGKQAPEEIEAALSRCVDGYFFTAGEDTLQAVLESAEPFPGPQDHVSGAALTFSVFSFPTAAGGAPDPVALLREYSKTVFPAAFVMGLDAAAQPVWKPDDATPALYWRLQETGPCSYIEDTWSCVWQTVTLRLHVFPGAGRQALCRRICDGLRTSRRLLFPQGGGQLLIDDARVAPGDDVQRQGQVTLTASFGVLRPEEPKTKLRHIHYDDQNP